MIVAIDGPAGVGKSTVTRCVAEKQDLSTLILEIFTELLHISLLK